MGRKRHKRMERLGVYVDMNNLWHSAMRFGSDKQIDGICHVDITKLLRYIHDPTGSKHPKRVVSIKRLFIGRKKGDNKDGFINYLRSMGFKVEVVMVDEDEGGAYTYNCCSVLSAGVLADCEDWDILCLCSGNGAYVDVVDQVQQKGKRVEVYSFSAAISMALKNKAHAFYPLGRKQIVIHKRQEDEENDCG